LHFGIKWYPRFQVVISSYWDDCRYHSNVIVWIKGAIDAADYNSSASYPHGCPRIILPLVFPGHSSSAGTPLCRGNGRHISTVNVKFLIAGSSSLIQCTDRAPPSSLRFHRTLLLTILEQSKPVEACISVGSVAKKAAVWTKGE